MCWFEDRFVVKWMQNVNASMRWRQFNFNYPFKEDNRCFIRIEAVKMSVLSGNSANTNFLKL